MEIGGEGVGPGGGKGAAKFDRLLGGGERRLPPPEIAEHGGQVVEGQGEIGGESGGPGGGEGAAKFDGLMASFTLINESLLFSHSIRE